MSLLNCQFSDDPEGAMGRRGFICGPDVLRHGNGGVERYPLMNGVLKGAEN